MSALFGSYVEAGIAPEIVAEFLNPKKPFPIKLEQTSPPRSPPPLKQQSPPSLQTPSPPPLEQEQEQVRPEVHHHLSQQPSFQYSPEQLQLQPQQQSKLQSRIQQAPLMLIVESNKSLKRKTKLAPPATKNKKKKKLTPDEFILRILTVSDEFDRLRQEQCITTESGLIYRELYLTRPNLGSFHKEILFPDPELGLEFVTYYNRKPLEIQTLILANHKFIITSFLSVARVFQFNLCNSENNIDLEQFQEIKRVPHRWIDIVPNIITGIHISDEKIYIAYCWGHENNPDKSYIEITSLYSDSYIGTERIFYGELVDKIYSDRQYLYVILSDGLVHIHRKDWYDCNYQLDYSLLCNDINEQVVAVRVVNQLSKFDNLSVLVCIGVTKKELLISSKCHNRHDLLSCFRFDDSNEFDIIDLDVIETLIIITRRSTNRGQFSHLELGYIRVGDVVEFTTDISFVLRSSIIRTLVLQTGFVIILSQKSTNKPLYEVACLWLPKMQFVWVTIVEDVDHTCNMTAIDENHVVIAKTCQDFINIQININSRVKCPQCDLYFPDQEVLNLHDKKGHRSSFINVICRQDEMIRRENFSALKKLGVV